LIACGEEFEQQKSKEKHALLTCSVTLHLQETLLSFGAHNGGNEYGFEVHGLVLEI